MADAQASGMGPSIDQVDIPLREYETSDRLALSETAIQALESKINDEQTRIEVIEKRDGSVRLKATQHVGIVSLPDGPTIEIRPKAPGTDLLSLLRYAYGVEATTIEESTSLSAGRAFIEALAALYKTELDTAIERGLHRDYNRTSESVPYLRGRIDVQRQLQRRGPTPTEFECTYDELTVDTMVNQAVLYATSILVQLVRDPILSQALDRHQQLLRRRVTLTPVRPVELEGIELSRLSSHYVDLIRLTELVLRSVYIEDLHTGSRTSFALLVDMDRVFELAVERAVREAATGRSGWTVEGQASSQTLVTGGKRSITIKPDVLVRDGNDRPVIVGDAKWKLDDPDSRSPEPSNSDIYQLVAYQLAHDVPGILFYPAQDGRVKSKYNVNQLHPLQTVEIPLTVSEQNQSYAETVKSEIESALTLDDLEKP